MSSREEEQDFRRPDLLSKGFCRPSGKSEVWVVDPKPRGGPQKEGLEA